MVTTCRTSDNTITSSGADRSTSQQDTSNKAKRQVSNDQDDNSMRGQPISSQKITPRPSDILSGRGKASFNHQGNQQFRSLINSLMPRYEQARSMKNPKREVVMLTKHILDLFKNHEPRVRILIKNKEGEWEEADRTVARKKVSHAVTDRYVAIQNKQKRQDSRTKIKQKIESRVNKEPKARTYTQKSQSNQQLVERLGTDLVSIGGPVNIEDTNIKPPARAQINPGSAPAPEPPTYSSEREVSIFEVDQITADRYLFGQIQQASIKNHEKMDEWPHRNQGFIEPIPTHQVKHDRQLGEGELAELGFSVNNLINHEEELKPQAPQQDSRAAGTEPTSNAPGQGVRITARDHATVNQYYFGVTPYHYQNPWAMPYVWQPQYIPQPPSVYAYAAQPESFYFPVGGHSSHVPYESHYLAASGQSSDTQPIGSSVQSEPTTNSILNHKDNELHPIHQAALHSEALDLLSEVALNLKEMGKTGQSVPTVPDTES